MSVFSRLLRDDDALVTVEWSVLAGFAAVGFTMQAESIGVLLDGALDEMRAGLRELLS